jgi:uncharacterized RDD family membrane protein YckC
MAPAGYGPSGVATLAPNGKPLASVGDRFLARLVDFAAYFVISLVITIPAVIAIVALASTGTTVSSDGSRAQLASGSLLGIVGVYIGIFVLFFIVRYVYEVEIPKRTGQTFGKRVMKTAVVPLDPGIALTRGIMVKRWLVYGVADAIVPFLGLLDALWLLWDKPWRQCLHDKFAQTVVVKVNV